jgi:copper(I)-binding protein
VRGTVTGQQATGAFLEITSKSGAALVGATSPAAAISEIHEMKMDGGVMKMRPVPAIEIRAKGEAVLRPGGLHVMMIDLKAPMKEGDSVPITLTFDDGSSKQVDARVVKATAAPVPTEHRQH